MLEAKIDLSAADDNVLVAAVDGKRIQLVRVFFVVSGIVSVKFRDGDSDLTGAIDLAARGSFVLDAPNDGQGWFTTGTGRALVLNLSTGVQTSGRVYYRLVK